MRDRASSAPAAAAVARVERLLLCSALLVAKDTLAAVRRLATPQQISDSLLWLSQARGRSVFVVLRAIAPGLRAALPRLQLSDGRSVKQSPRTAALSLDQSGASHTWAPLRKRAT